MCMYILYTYTHMFVYTYVHIKYIKKVKRHIYSFISDVCICVVIETKMTITMAKARMMNDVDGESIDVF